jgi:hypothetical protein
MISPAVVASYSNNNPNQKATVQNPCSSLLLEQTLPAVHISDGASLARTLPT